MLKDIGVVVVGLMVGLFGLCNILLPIFYLLPRVVRQVKAGSAPGSKIFKCFIAPVTWAAVIYGLYLLAGKYHLDGQLLIGLSAGGGMALLGILSGKAKPDMEADAAGILEEKKGGGSR